MSNFTDEEISKLQSGGNEVGRALWLAKWNNTIYALPNPGEEKRIIRFMKHTFEKQTWKQGEGNAAQKPAVAEVQKPSYGGFTPVPVPSNKPKVANPGDDWEDDPFGPATSAPVYKPPQQHHQPQQPPQQQPQQTPTFNLLGGPISPTPLVPQSQAIQPQQQVAPPAQPIKSGWDDINFTIPTATPTTAAPTGSFDQKRLDLQRQQEELARQQQALQQQALQQQAMQQAMQQQAMQQQAMQQMFFQQQQQQQHQQQQQMMMGIYAQPPYMAQPQLGQQFPPVMQQQAPPPQQPKAADPFANLNWL